MRKNAKDVAFRIHISEHLVSHAQVQRARFCRGPFQVKEAHFAEREIQHVNAGKLKVLCALADFPESGLAMRLTRFVC